MALRPCPECKREISDKAEACPHCGAKQKKKALGGGCMLLLIIIGAFAFFGWLMDSSPSGGGGAPAKQQRAADVSIAYNATAIELTNKGTADWPTAEIYINGTPPFTYKASVAAPPIGESVRIPLSSFVKKDGTRFNPLTHAVTEIWVGGGGFDFERYRIDR